MRTSEFRDIVYRKDETGVVTVILNTPKRKNAMSPYTFLELYWAIDAFESDATAGAMVLTGAKDPDTNDPTKEAFSSGGYFNPQALDGLAEEVVQQIDLMDIAQKKMALKMYGCDKPIIAAINGLAIGAGYTMPLCGADLIYMSEYAWIRLPFAKLGITAEFALSYLLPRMMGFQRAKEIVYFAKTINAQEAKGLGMVNEVLPHDQLIPYAIAQARELIPPAGAGFAIRQMKQVFHQPYLDAISNALDAENLALNNCFKTSDFGEGLTARMERRPPVFKGE